MKPHLLPLPALLVCSALLTYSSTVGVVAVPAPMLLANRITAIVRAQIAAAKAAQVAAAAKPLPPPAVAPAPIKHQWIHFHDLKNERLDFDVKHYQKPIKFSLKHKPKGKVTVFLQGDNLQFDRCGVSFTPNDYNKPQTVYATAAPYFTDAAVPRNLNVRFAISASKDEKLNKKEDVLAVVREKGSGAICQSSGDPHYKSFGGRLFDFQGVGGPFTLVDSKRLTIQFITKKWINSAYVNDAVAIRYNDVVFIVCSKQGLTTFDPNGVLAKKAGDGRPLINVMQSKRGADTKFRDFRFHFPDGNAVELGINHAHMDYVDITVKMACHMQGKLKGICGPYDAAPNNRFIMSNGKETPDPNALGQSYRVPADKSLFHCAKTKKCDSLRPLKVHAANTCIIPPIKDVEVEPIVGYELPPAGYAVATKFDAYKVEPKIEPKPPKPQPNYAPTNALQKAAEAACRATFKPFANSPILKPTGYERNCIADVVLSGKFTFVDQHKTDYLEMVRTLTKTLTKEPIMAVASAVASGGKAATTTVVKKLEESAKDSAYKIADALKAVAGYGLGKKKCPNDCSGNGECMVDGCKCKPGFTGLSCDVNLQQYTVPKEKAYKTEPAPPPKPIVLPPPPIKEVVKEAYQEIPIPKGGYVIADAYATGGAPTAPADEAAPAEEAAAAGDEEPKKEEAEAEAEGETEGENENEQQEESDNGGE